MSGPAYFRYNSVGTLVRESVQGGRRTSVWVSDQPVNIFNIVGGRWQVRKGEGMAVYFDASHPYNVETIGRTLDAARNYYSEWFRPYPWRELKLSEFPNLATYAQGFPTNITFSEGVGFLIKDEPGASMARLVTAHEAAHQWWGNLVAPGKGPGGELVSEGTAHFSTLLLIEQLEGPRGRIDFCRRVEEAYNNGRSPDSERPLVKTDG